MAEDKEKATAKTVDAKDEKKAEKKETKKIKFLLSPCGKFLLPYNVGQVVELPVNQADEIVDCKYAEYVK